MKKGSDFDKMSGYSEILDDDVLYSSPWHDDLWELSSDLNSDPYSVVASYYKHGYPRSDLGYYADHGNVAPWSFREVLKQLHYYESKSAVDMAHLFGCTEQTVSERLNEYDFYDPMSDVNSSPSWSVQRQKALDRDGVCVRCGCENDLEVHHIVPRKHFDDERVAHILENLVVLCSSCHGEVEYQSPRQWFFTTHVDQTEEGANLV